MAFLNLFADVDHLARFEREVADLEAAKAVLIAQYEEKRQDMRVTRLKMLRENDKEMAQKIQAIEQSVGDGAKKIQSGWPCSR